MKGRETPLGASVPSLLLLLGRNRQSPEHGLLPPVPRQVLLAEPAQCLREGARAGGELGEAAARGPGVLRRLPAVGGRGGAAGPRAASVRLQEMPCPVLQVPQRPPHLHPEGERLAHGPRQVQRKVRGLPVSRERCPAVLLQCCPVLPCGASVTPKSHCAALVFAGAAGSRRSRVWKEVHPAWVSAHSPFPSATSPAQGWGWWGVRDVQGGSGVLRHSWLWFSFLPLASQENLHLPELGQTGRGSPRGGQSRFGCQCQACPSCSWTLGTIGNTLSAMNGGGRWWNHCP